MSRRDELSDQYEKAKVAFESVLGTSRKETGGAISPEDNVLAGFADRWMRLHRYALAGLAENQTPQGESRDFDHEARLLLRRRQALVSACAQAFARDVEREPSLREAVEATRRTLLSAIEAHDAVFGSLVQMELGRLKSELTRAHEAKKALGGYARTLQYRGE